MKHSLGHLTIWRFFADNKITTKDGKLMVEAFRRKHFLKTTTGWLGLGTPSQYKSQYFRAHGTEIARVNNWYVLTKDGETIMQKMEAFFAIPKRYKKRNEVNHFLFTF